MAFKLKSKDLVMQLSNLLQPSYWLAEAPQLTPLGLWSMVVLFGVLLVASVVLKIISAKADPALARGERQIARLSGWLGLFGLVILFFRYEFVPILSRRFVYLIWLAIAIPGALSIINYFKKQLPETRRREAERRRKEKYLP